MNEYSYVNHPADETVGREVGLGKSSLVTAKWKEEYDREVQAYRNWLAARAAGKKKAATALRRRKNKMATASRRQQRRA